MATIAEELAAATVDDDFNRSESPLDNGGKWVAVDGVASPGRCGTSPVGYNSASAFSNGENAAYWTPEAFDSAGGFIYVMVTISKIAGTSQRQAGVWLCHPESNPGVSSGYFLRAEKTAGTDSIQWTIEKWVEGSSEVLDAVGTTDLPVGSQMALVVGEGEVKFFARATEEVEFAELLSAEDSTYTKGYSGVRSRGINEFYIRDFRTGAFGGEESEPTAPEVVTGEATSIGASKATLNGTVNPNGAATSYYFQLVTQAQFEIDEWASATQIPAEVLGSAGEGTEAVAVDEEATGLESETAYRFRLLATNSKGADVGDAATFETLDILVIQAPAAAVTFSVAAPTVAVEGPVVIEAPAASVAFSAAAPTVVITTVTVIRAPAALATFSAAAPSVAVGPMPSPTEQRRGLPLPHPSILANPARLGPPRFTALERKTLGLD